MQCLSSKNNKRTSAENNCLGQDNARHGDTPFFYLKVTYISRSK